MLVTEQEISGIRDFVSRLNSDADSAVIVEGKRDSAALKKLGYSGTILEFHSFGGMARFADRAAEYDCVILLFDGDRKGRQLTCRAIQLLERRTRIDMSYKKRLLEITDGKIMFIEQLVCYTSYLERNYGQTPF